MKVINRTIAFSATDLVNYLGCRHSTYLDVRALQRPAVDVQEDPFLVLLQAKGLAHERAYRDRLIAEGRVVIDLAADTSGIDRVRLTREAMASGAEVVYQGALADDRWHGYADFLCRVPGASALGAFHYEAVDTKLSSIAKPKHALQLAVYSDLLAATQGVVPEAMHIVVGDGGVVRVETADLRHYTARAQRSLEAFAARLPVESVGEPCAHCAQCRWSSDCEDAWSRIDHLTQVAGISRSQRTHLTRAGISTMAALAALPPESKVAGLRPEMLTRFRAQARLQVAKREDGENRLELLTTAAGKGFARMPPPDPGDLYFDMEGDPLFPEGLEYLFGFVEVSAGTPRFTALWGHDRAAEKVAFEQAMDLISAQLRRHADAHIYHYAAYEESALKRLAMLHGTRESAVDDLLRGGKLVDLYQIVREAIQVSEPSYSIKNLETFYMAARQGDVKDAGASVVMYEHWRQLQDPKLLQEIAEYNEFDCLSTWKLRDWLLSLRPPGAPWFTPAVETVSAEKVVQRTAAQLRCDDVQQRLLAAPETELPFRELVGQLLEFHRREAKPAWWAMFNRQEMSEEELIEDPDCIGGLRPDPTRTPQPVKKSMVHHFTFPPQDFKLREGMSPRRASTLKSAGQIVALDEDTGRISLKIGPSAEPFEAALSLIPEGPLETVAQREALYRYAGAVIAGSGTYGAVTSILRRDPPRIRGLAAGAAIVADGTELIAAASRAIRDLDESHLLIQGPPGTGKTYLSAAVILTLLAGGQRVGVASNSHKAINNLLAEVERQALRVGQRFRGVKKCSRGANQEHAGILIGNAYDNDEVVSGKYALIGGTSWLFAREDLDQSLDYLFVDEAGQVAIANIVAMGLSARNIVLVGDQRQLSQPAQGVHPGDSGLSALDFMLKDLATVPPGRGVFLPVTRRMHPDVCRFISEAVYDGRLDAAPGNDTQRLELEAGTDPVLKPAGIAWLAVPHQDCRQRSEAEGRRIQALYTELLEQRWITRDGVHSPLGIADILVVSPYNLQVNYLQSLLPPAARVGTVDKFQGQEAAVVVVSMTTSSAEDVARGMDFLYSRNRLNVAVSRAKCLAIVVACPALLDASGGTIEELKLVNLLSFLSMYGSRP